jgi:competence protein ComEC
MEPYAMYRKQAVVLVGTATDDGVYGRSSQTVFSVDHAHIASPVAVDVPGRVSVAGFGVNAVFRGDRIRVDGKLMPTRGSNQAAVSYAKLQVIERNGSPVDAFRRKFAAGMQSALPEPVASFGMGLLIGQRSTLPQAVADSLLAVGLTHIIAVSGYNLTIIVEAARRLFGNRSKYQMTAVCVTLIIVFVTITGNSPSIVRASVISLISIAAWYFGRTLNAMVLLLTAAAITVVANPLYIWGNVSWYLSFLAFFGVVVLGPLITWRLYKDKKPGLVMQVLIESICAEVMTLPYILYIFGQMSTVSLLANVLVVALVPLAMLLCVVAGCLGMALPAIAGWFAWPAQLVLTYMLDAAALLSRIPHAFLENIGFSFVQLLGWYGVVGVWMALVHYKKERDYDRITGKIGYRTEGV